ncbi:hypothetical protein M8C21_020256, partial [Ambrosia artemisiifolia]
MALQFYQIISFQTFFAVCKPERNIQQILKSKTKQHRQICFEAKTNMNIDEKVSELEKKNGYFNTLQLLEHIDDIERLALGYRFQNHIQRLLDLITSMYGIKDELDEEEVSLHEASLRFRILRKHGYNDIQEYNHGGFTGCLQTDVKEFISLYEASHLAFVEESDLLEAKFFATEHLLKLIYEENDSLVVERINHVLEIPLYHRMLRLQVRSYIESYNTRQDANLHLLELAALDYNMTQRAFKKELKELSKWWKSTGLAHKSGFVRDRLMECFFWTVGVVCEPQYYSCRVGLTKVCALITVVRDINAMGHMPVYYNLWGELLEAFLVEAKWTQDKYIPSLEDYLDNAW